MKDDLNGYEEGYLKRVEKAKELRAKQERRMKAEQERQRKRKKAEQERQRKRKKEAEMKERERLAEKTVFSVWDHVLLESIRRNDPRVRIRIGTLKVLDSMERLFECGQMEKKTAMPFDEMERLEAFRDSAEYAMYKRRIERIITTEVDTYRLHVFDRIGIRTIVDPLVLTPAGLSRITGKRDEMRKIWDRLNNMRSKGDAEFPAEVQKSMANVPLFLAMGIAGGPLYAYMIAHSQADHVHGMEYIERYPFGGSSFDESAFDGGFDSFHDAF